MHRPALLLLLLWTGCAAEEFAPGKHDDVDTGVPGQTFDCYVPKAYAEKTAEDFPVVFISDAGGNPGLHGLEGWAERNEVVLVTINGSKNGPGDLIAAAQDAVTGAALKRLRLDGCLRFSMGNSGAGMASAHLAAKFGDAWGGALILVNARRGAKLAKHVAVGWLAGAKDDVFPAKDTQADYEMARSEGRPARIKIFPDRGHDGMMPREDEEAMLSWMLELQRYSHPKRTKEEVEAGTKRLAARAVELSASTDHAAVIAEADTLLGIDAVAKSKEAAAVRLAWCRATLAGAGEGSEPIASYRVLESVMVGDRAAALPAPERKAIQSRMSELRKDKAVKADIDSRAALAAARQQEAKAKTAKGALRDAAKAYAAIATRWPDTEAGKTAKDEAERISAVLQ